MSKTVLVLVSSILISNLDSRILASSLETLMTEEESFLVDGLSALLAESWTSFSAFKLLQETVEVSSYNSSIVFMLEMNC